MLPPGCFGCGIGSLLVSVEHPTFGKSWIMSAHLTADPIGMLTGDWCCGSAQLGQVRALLQYADTAFSDGADGADNLVICGDFNELSCAASINEILNHDGAWGHFLDCAFQTFSTAGTLPSSCYPPVKPCCCIPMGSFRIDYCFLAEQSKHLWPVHSAVEQVQHSDHMPLIVDFEYRDALNEEEPRVPRQKWPCVCVMCVCVLIVVSTVVSIGVSYAVQ